MRIVEILIMVALILPGIILMVFNEKKLIHDFLPDEKIPPFWVRMLNHFIMAVPLAVLGVFFYSKAGFTKPSFAGINETSLLLGLVCALVHVAYYYGYFIKKVDKDTIAKVDHSRKQLGIFTRLIYGGIVEEVIFRFGLMSFFVWIGNLVIDNQLISMWIGNLVAAILFALVHLPAIYQMKIKITKTLLIYSNSMNIMVGLFCGWLYWSEGLAAAILCHILFHLVWYFFEKMNKVAESPNIFNVKGE
jgi:membrane protease YdiL (CAAX protease family)